MIEKHLQDPEQTVLSFTTEFNDWETRMSQEASPFAKPELCKEHDLIIQKYCTLKARKHVDGIFSFAVPPTYVGVKKEYIVKTEKISESEVVVETKRDNCKAYQFVVYKTDDGWRIDHIKWQLAGEWQITIIGS